MNHRAIALIALACLLSACGSASDAVTFTAPPAYKADVSIGPFAQTWSGPGHSMIMLMALPTKMDINKPMQGSPVGNATIQRDQKITICNGQAARYGEMEGTSVAVGSPNPGGKRAAEEIEFVMTSIQGKTYMALYARPLGALPDRAAETAIHNVCPK
jgi:hypothetical protein